MQWSALTDQDKEAEEESETLYSQYSSVTAISPQGWEVVGRHQPLNSTVH